MAVTVPVLSKIPNLLQELTKVLPSINFHAVLEPEKDLHFNKSEILICDFDLFAKHVYTLPQVKWVQGTWAGIDKLKPHIHKPVPYQITRFTGDHFGKMMGEYIIAQIVNYERNFFQVGKNQEKREWNREGNIENYRAIFDLTIGILGVGNIGNRIGQILHFLGAEILAFGRRPTLPQTEEYSHISQYYTKETLPSFLKNCDYIINVLPKTEDTDHLLENDILENCSEKQSIFINIGRSNILSESTLIKALNKKWILAAILDVFETEPLPKNSPLWTMDRVFITPHVAGVSRAKNIAEQFCSNYKLFTQKLPLPAKIDFTKGY